MFCSKCNKKIASGIEKCEACGRKTELFGIAEFSLEAVKLSQMQSDKEVNATNTPYGYRENIRNLRKEKENEVKKKLYVIIAVLVIAFLLIIFGFLSLKGKEDNEKEYKAYPEITYEIGDLKPARIIEELFSSELLINSISETEDILKDYSKNNQIK